MDKPYDQDNDAWGEWNWPEYQPTTDELEEYDGLKATMAEQDEKDAGYMHDMAVLADTLADPDLTIAFDNWTGWRVICRLGAWDNPLINLNNRNFPKDTNG